jgi:flagellar hook-basal body complex protein FliE
MVEGIKGGLVNTAIAGLKKTDSGAPEAGGSFGNILKDSIEKVNKIQTEADRAIEGLASGEVKNVHETMIAIEKANLSFNMMLQVRNKLLAAYEEVMRMQV